MSGPWEDYQSTTTVESGPWEDYGGESPSVVTAAELPTEKPGFLGGIAETLLPTGEGLMGMGRAALDIISGKPGSPAATALIEPHIEQFHKANQALKEGRYSEAAGYLGGALLPFVGPAAATAGERIGQGEVARGLGNTVGLLAPFGAETALKGTARVAGKVLPKVEETLYQSALKPSTTYAPEKRVAILRTGIKEGIPVSKKGLAKTGEMLKQLRNDIENRIAEFEAANPDVSIDPAQAAQRIETPGGIREQYAGIRKGENLAAIEQVKSQFLEDYPEVLKPSEAQKLKQSGYKDLGERAYEKRTGAGPAAEKQILRGLKEELEQLIPELKTMNQREGSLIQFNKALGRAIAREKNHQWFGIGTPAAGGLGYALGGQPAAWAAAGLKFILDKPGVKSSLAILMNRARQIREAGPTIESGGKVIARNLEPIQNAKREFASKFLLPKGANSAFGSQKELVAEAIRRDPVSPESAIRAINRKTQEYLDHWQELDLEKSKTVYTREGEEGVITGRAQEMGGGYHPSEIAGISDLPDSPKQIKEAFTTKYGATYNRLKAKAEQLATEDHVADLVLDESTKERIYEATSGDDLAYRKRLVDEVTSVLSGASKDLPD